MKFHIKNSSTLLEALVQAYPDSAKSKFRKWAKNKQIYIDGAVTVRLNTPINSGQQIEITDKQPDINFGIQILYEDEYLVVIDKPHGCLSVATDKETQITAHNALKKRTYKKRVYPVHRLDRDTSGVMMFTYHTDVKQHLKEQFFHHSVERKYIAVLEGHLTSDSGVWEHYLYEDASFFTKITEKGQGKKAITHYKVLKRTRKNTHVEFTLKTGRKNQIRAQAQHMGHPIVGDHKYGHCIQNSNRLYLHAKLLSFTHPILNKKLVFSSKTPWS